LGTPHPHLVPSSIGKENVLPFTWFFLQIK
jgi:hypothetical protein